MRCRGKKGGRKLEEVTEKFKKNGALIVTPWVSCAAAARGTPLVTPTPDLSLPLSLVPV